jgi:vacuolar iron transporter family protein
VLGANDGLLSVSSLMMGVGAAAASRSQLLVAGFAAMAGGALSMAAGEYGSVSSQRDTELADLERERLELVATPEAELHELAGIYRQRGLSQDLAHQVATQLSAGNALEHHAREELGLELGNLARPVQAAGVSALSFALGAALPVILAIVLSSAWRGPATVAGTLVGLTGLGVVGAHLGGAPKGKAAARLLVLGAVALAGTTLVGKLVGVAV